MLSKFPCSVTGARGRVVYENSSKVIYWGWADRTGREFELTCCFFIPHVWVGGAVWLLERGQLSVLFAATKS